jgi:hypothetical protein
MRGWKMRKRSRYDAEAESGGWIGRGVLGIGALALVMLAGGWWLFASNSDSSIRKFCLSRISVMVDRFDQASEAWKNRSVHAANANKKKPSPLTSGKSGVSAKDPAAPEPAPGPDASAPAEPAPITPGAEPAAAAPPGGQTAEQAVEPPGEVTAEDREALKKILASGTKPDPKSAAKPAPVKTEPRPEPKIEAKTDLREKPAAVPGKIEPNDQEQLRSLLKSLH